MDRKQRSLPTTPPSPRPIISPAQIYLLSAFAIVILYFYGLDKTGMLGPDEPRYASVGREMARSGNWVTPKLWGQPWFEKPALLYWMTAIGFTVGLDEDLAPRLPVAIVSAVFLALLFRDVRRKFGLRPAVFATAILGTSAGWLAFSQVGVTDLPLAVTFNAAVLLAMEENRTREILGGVALGLAVLAKGLVPLVLVVPFVVWLLYQKRWRAIALMPLACVVTAAPWYVLCTMQNGTGFLVDFFWKHHFERFTSDVLQHRQPFWFYIPVFIASFFPWCALVALPFRREMYRDRRLLLFAATVLFGLLFFSASVNKLPGYILPLLPGTAILIGVSLDAITSAKWWLASAGVLLGVIPLAAEVLPDAIAFGLSHAHPSLRALLGFIPAAMIAVSCWVLDRSGHRPLAVSVMVAMMTAGVLYMKSSIFPRIDYVASVRPVWKRVAPLKGMVCDQDLQRAWLYGINYYAGGPLPTCQPNSPVKIVAGQNGRPVLIENFVQ